MIIRNRTTKTLKASPLNNRGYSGSLPYGGRFGGGLPPSRGPIQGGGAWTTMYEKMLF